MTSSLSHLDAREIVRSAWRSVVGEDPSETELTLAQAIALLETGYGRIGQFAAMAARGQYNWGALERHKNADGSCPPGSVPGSDAGNPRCFYVFDSDEKAAAAFLRNLVGGGSARSRATLAAMKSGSASATALAMKTPPAWYEASALTYASAIGNAVRTIQTAITRGGTTASATNNTNLILGSALTVAGVSGLGFVAWKMWPRRKA